MNREKLDEVTAEINATIKRKNIAYGDSVNRAPQCMEILCPDGIPPEKFRDAACVLRVLDKLSRALSMPEGSDEENPWADAAAYCLMRATEIADRPPSGPLPPADPSALFVALADALEKDRKR